MCERVKEMHAFPGWCTSKKRRLKSLSSESGLEGEMCYWKKRTEERTLWISDHSECGDGLPALQVIRTWFATGPKGFRFSVCRFAILYILHLKCFTLSRIRQSLMPKLYPCSFFLWGILREAPFLLVLLTNCHVVFYFFYDLVRCSVRLNATFGQAT